MAVVFIIAGFDIQEKVYYVLPEASTHFSIFFILLSELTNNHTIKSMVTTTIRTKMIFALDGRKGTKLCCEEITSRSPGIPTYSKDNSLPKAGQLSARQWTRICLRGVKGWDTEIVEKHRGHKEMCGCANVRILKFWSVCTNSNISECLHHSHIRTSAHSHIPLCPLCFSWNSVSKTKF